MRLVIELSKKYSNITGEQADKFAADLDSLLNKDFNELIFDFTDINALNSTTIGNLFAFHIKLEKMGKKLYIINVSKKIERLFHIVNLGNLIS